jgi:hypothetical protein
MTSYYSAGAQTPPRIPSDPSSSNPELTWFYIISSKSNFFKVPIFFVFVTTSSPSSSLAPLSLSGGLFLNPTFQSE